MKGKIIDNKNQTKKNGCFNLDNLSSFDAADVFKTVVQSKADYEKTKEEETTKRLAIEKATEIHLANIKSKKETLESIAKSRFDERKKTIDRSFDVLERALDEDKDALAIAAMNNITDIVKESPLKDFDSISNALKNDDIDLML
jgi:predicted nuclease with TOPRIM domain